MTGKSANDGKAGFPLFVVVWNRLQGYETPDIHFVIAHWLEKCWREDRRRMLLMAFRASGKSTLVGLFAAWLLYRNPDLRILVLAADLPLAARMVRNVRRIVERHPLTAAIRPHRPDQWASDRFTVQRNRELRDPSMRAGSVLANMTGSRADIVICDDVEVPNTCNTADRRADLRARLAEIDYVLVPGGSVLYIGTPHTYYSIYADAPRAEIGEDKIFLEGYARMKLPIRDKAGRSAWPGRYPEPEIAALEARSGPHRFRSQMMLEPVNIAESRLDPADLRVYTGELSYSESGGRARLALGEKRLVSASAWWDPAFGAAGGDSSVLAVVFCDEQGEYWLHRLAYIRIAAGESETDVATRQCRAIARIAREMMLPAIALEINGLGRFLPGILRRELARLAVGCAVVEISSRRPKSVRILEALDAVLAARALHVHRSVLDTPLVREMQEWRPGSSSGGHDDGLDALAGALSRQPVRIGAGLAAAPGRPAWQGAGKAFTADHDFEV